MKTAVVLFNIGGPDRSESVKPFLYNFFRDKNIINLPDLPRTALAWLISTLRYKKSIINYNHIGGHSPLLQNTVNQSNALQEKLGENAKCFIAMRYWNPLIKDVAKEVALFAPDKIILLPLYPQYSYATTKSSFEEWDKHYKEETEVVKILSYECNDLFIAAHVDNIIKFTEINNNDTIVLFSAHGIPQKFVENGDPYEKQINATVNAIVSKLKIKNHKLCYQSRVGPMEWLRPYFKDTIAECSGKDVVVVPIAFVSEHIETLIELDVEYKELAEKSGVRSYKRVPTLSENPLFIEALYQICKTYE